MFTRATVFLLLTIFHTFSSVSIDDLNSKCWAGVGQNHGVEVGLRPDILLINGNFLLRDGLALTIKIPQNRFVIKDENRSSKAKFSKKKKKKWLQILSVQKKSK